MRLGFHYHIPAISTDTGIFMPGYFGRFIDSLGTKVESIICFLHYPLNNELEMMDYKIQGKNITLVLIGLHSSVPKRLFSIRKVNHIIEDYLDLFDIMLIRGPSPLLPSIARASSKKPISLLLVGDQLNGVDGLAQPFFRKLAIRVFWYINQNLQLNVAKKSLTFVNSQLLFNQLEKKVRNIKLIHTTTLDETDGFRRIDTCNGEIISLLYVGRIDRTKGLLEIVKAVALLKEKNYLVNFNIVGPQVNGDNTLPEILCTASELNVTSQVVYRGYHRLGPDLFSYYINSDIFINGSLDSEGFPRTIWEAMAHSLPVIATSVGSIPFFLTREALLIPPRNIEAIASAVITLIDDSTLRQQLIANGRDMVKDITLDNQSEIMVNEISNYLSGYKYEK